LACTGIDKSVIAKSNRKLGLISSFLEKCQYIILKLSFFFKSCGAISKNGEQGGGVKIFILISLHA
jgi:hypothetical protein